MHCRLGLTNVLRVDERPHARGLAGGVIKVLTRPARAALGAVAPRCVPLRDQRVRQEPVQEPRAHELVVRGGALLVQALAPDVRVAQQHAPQLAAQHRVGARHDLLDQPRDIHPGIALSGQPQLPALQRGEGREPALQEDVVYGEESDQSRVTFDIKISFAMSFRAV